MPAENGGGPTGQVTITWPAGEGMSRSVRRVLFRRFADLHRFDQ